MKTVETPNRERSRLFRKIAGYAIFVGALFILIVVFAILRADRIVVAKQLAKAEKELRYTDASLDTIWGHRTDSANKVDFVHSVMEKIRSPNEIPDLHDDRIISVNKGDRVVLYVPEGKHRLKVEARVEYRNSSSKNSASTVSLVATPDWTVDLRSQSGYIFKFIEDRASGISWRVDGKHPEFVAREESIVDEKFVNSSGSSGGYQRFDLPCKLSFIGYGNPRPSSFHSNTLVVGGTTFTGRLDGKLATIKVTVSVASQCTPSVSWEDYEGLSSRSMIGSEFRYDGEGIFRKSSD